MKRTGLRQAICRHVPGVAWHWANWPIPNLCFKLSKAIETEEDFFFKSETELTAGYPGKKKIKNTQKRLKRKLFNQTKLDKMCKFLRESSPSKSQTT